MKVILTGATGFIGSEILARLIAHPTITSIIAISRRSLPTTTSSSSPKLKTILLNDFKTEWPSSVLDECAGAEACIWALGLATLDAEQNREINYDYPLAGFRSLVKVLGSEKGQTGQKGRRKRFVYMSGVLAEKDQERTLWFLCEGRKLRGRTELELVQLGTIQQEDAPMEAYVVRPGVVQKKDVGFVTSTLISAGGLMPQIGVDELAAATIDIATTTSNNISGEEGVVEMRQIWDNEELVKRGRGLLVES